MTRARSVRIARAGVLLALCFGAHGVVAAAPQSGPPAPATVRGAGKVPAPGPVPAWPEPPAPPRVRYLGALTPDAAQGRPSRLGRIWRAIVGPADRPVMRQPYGMAMGQKGKLYVTDTVGGTIHVFDLLRPGYSRIETDGGSLVGIAARGDELFVTDSVKARVVCLSTSGKRRWSAGPEQGFQRPTGIVATADGLFVVDTLASQVVELDPSGKVTRRFGSRGEGPGQFNFPTSIAADREGRLYVTDTLNFRVQVFGRDGSVLSSFGKLGDGSGDFTRPKGLALDADGNIHVVEGLQDVVQIFSGTGRFLLAYGESGSGNGQLWLATGITIAEDAVYVADSANSRVQVYQYVRDPR